MVEWVDNWGRPLDYDKRPINQNKMNKKIPMWRTKFLAIWNILTGKYKHFVLLNTNEQGRAILSRETLTFVLGDCLVADIVQHGLKDDEVNLFLKHLLSITPTPFSSNQSDEIEVTAVKKKDKTINDMRAERGYDPLPTFDGKPWERSKMHTLVDRHRPFTEVLDDFGEPFKRTVDEIWNKDKHLSLYDFYLDLCSEYGEKAYTVNDGDNWRHHYDQMTVKYSIAGQMGERMIEQGKAASAAYNHGLSDEDKAIGIGEVGAVIKFDDKPETMVEHEGKQMPMSEAVDQITEKMYTDYDYQNYINMCRNLDLVYEAKSHMLLSNPPKTAWIEHYKKLKATNKD